MLATEGWQQRRFATILVANRINIMLMTASSPQSPAPIAPPPRNFPVTGRKAGLINCHICHLACQSAGHATMAKPSGSEHSAGSAPTASESQRCPRCGARIRLRKANSLHRCWALVLASFILYLPANLAPITITTALGRPPHSDTIMSGVIYFMQTGSWHIAMIIFIASIVVPLMKLFILTFLLASLRFGWNWRPVERTRLYRLTELVGRWSMVDVFVVTILVALVRFGAFATIEAGPGAAYFAALVILTMFAAECFDPRVIWDRMEDEDA